MRKLSSLTAAAILVLEMAGTALAQAPDRSAHRIEHVHAVTAYPQHLVLSNGLAE